MKCYRLIQKHYCVSYPQRKSIVTNCHKQHFVTVWLAKNPLCGVREDIPSEILIKCRSIKNIYAAIFVEINLRTNRLILDGTYYSTVNEILFSEIGLYLDVYTNRFSKVILILPILTPSKKSQEINQLKTQQGQALSRRHQITFTCNVIIFFKCPSP